jgi:hypothetical protein
LELRLSPGTIGVVAIDTIDLEVLADLAGDLGQFQLDPSISEPLCRDVVETFARLADRRLVIMVPTRSLALPAFRMATFHNIPFADALPAALSEASGLPLLIADDDAYRRLRLLQEQRSNLRIVWLPDLM